MRQPSIRNSSAILSPMAIQSKLEPCTFRQTVGNPKLLASLDVVIMAREFSKRVATVWLEH